MNLLRKNDLIPLTTVILLIATVFVFSTPKVDYGPTKTITKSLNLTDNSYQQQSTGQFTDYLPNTYPDLLTRSRTISFVNKTRNHPSNELTSLDNIFYRLAAIKLLDPTLGNLSSLTKEAWINATLSFQNLNGGFGQWQYARSSISNTFKALKILNWLNYNGLNNTAVEVYLTRLRNSITGGFNSHLLDADSDVISSSYGVLSYQLLGVTPPNSTDLINLFQRAQNLNSSFVPSNELGGFGLQSNDPININWISEISVTRAAMLALNSLGSTAIDTNSAINFIQGMQSLSGGFVNNPNITVESVTFTSSAIEVLYLLGGTLVYATEAKNYLLSMELADGSFKLKGISTSSSLKATYFAVKGLNLLGFSPSNITKTLNYLLNWSPTTDGYGGYPGDSSSLRETFDAVAALTLAGSQVHSVQSLLNFVDNYRNPDGGYGLTGSFTESTLRVVEIYHMLGAQFPSPQETIAFLQGLQQSNGGFSKKAGSTQTYVISTYRAIRAMEILGATPSDTTAAIEYLRNNQNSDGGFGGYIGDTSDVSSTYRAIRALDILNSSPIDINGAKNFLISSQNPDGGFKRSPLDVTRPKNVSNIIYSYSASRALLILNGTINDPLGLYTYIAETRNRDGGYGEHPDFTSDVAYTFVSLWMLKSLNEISGLVLRVPDNLNETRSHYNNFTIEISGYLTPLDYIVTIGGNSVTNGSLLNSGLVLINTSNLSPGTYTLSITVTDLSGSTINVDLTLLISVDTLTTTSTTVSTTIVSSETTTTSPITTNTKTSPTELITIIIGILSVIWLKKRKFNE